jgi:hypothetical protein
VQQDVGHDARLALHPFRAVQRRKHARQALARGLVAGGALGCEDGLAVDLAAGGARLRPRQVGQRALVAQRELVSGSDRKM